VGVLKHLAEGRPPGVAAAIALVNIFLVEFPATPLNILAQLGELHLNFLLVGGDAGVDRRCFDFCHKIDLCAPWG